MKKVLLLIIAAGLSSIAPTLANDEFYGGAKNVPEFQPAFENQTRAPILKSGVQLKTTILATDFDSPWGIAVLPDGGYLITERSGQLRFLNANGELDAEPIKGVPDVFYKGQGGLLDVALAPDFADSRLVFLTYSRPMGNNLSATASARAKLSPDMRQLTEVEDIFVQTPPSPTPMHYGSRIVLHDGFAYITTGEHSSRQESIFSQHLDKTYGKIIRVTQRGEILVDNPFVAQEGAISSIFALGVRNVQGADLRPGTDEIWVLGHGPRGGDELNKLQAGANYGWPVVSYGENYNGSPVGSVGPRAEGFVEPQYYWDPVIAPSGFAFKEGDLLSEWNGNIIASSLNPGGIVRLTLDGDLVSGEERLFGDLGRVRDIEIDHDGAILALTDSGELVRIAPAD